MAERLRGRAAVAQRARRLAMHPLCARCLSRGWFTAATQVDHIVPLFKGGEDVDENTQNLCADCHRTKTDADLQRTSVPITGLDGWPQGGCNSSPPRAGNRTDASETLIP